MNETFSKQVLGGLRLGVGVVSLTSPRLAARVFGVNPKVSSDWITRLFGSRELALAAGLLAAEREQVSALARVGAAIDTVDALSSMLEFARGRISVYSLISGGGGAVLFAVLGFDAARRASANC